MIFRVLRVLMGRHLMFHLLVPLLFGLGIELGVIYYHNNFPGWLEFGKEKVSLILGVVVTYVLLASYLIYKETNIQVERSQLKDLEKALPSAQNFFATCTLSLKEWFEPSTQVYFAKLLRTQVENKNFAQRRVLLFFHNGEIKDSQSLFLDGRYANALVEIHRQFGIDLAFLTRRQIIEILSLLSVEEKKILGCYPAWLHWTPDIVLDAFLRMRRRIPELDFAFITHSDRGPTVFPFSKRGESLRVERQSAVLVYQKLMEFIEARIYEPGADPPRIRAQNEFSNKIEQF